MSSKILLFGTTLCFTLACGEVVDTSSSDAGDPADATQAHRDATLGITDARETIATTDAAPPPAPDTIITATPPNPDNATTTMFEFASSIPGGTFQCKLDNGNFAACTSPRTVSLNGDGVHTFVVFASNAGADDLTPARYDWTLDTVPPAISIDSGPMATATTNNARFEFTAEAGATLACRLDQGPFAACDGPTGHAFMGLALGQHRFEVRATDSANNQASATHEWIVEPPCDTSTIEAESLPDTGWNIATGGVLHGGKALDTSVIGNRFSFEFEGRGLIIYYRRGPSGGQYTVSIDDGPTKIVSAIDSVWSFQNAVTVASGLTSGPHTATITCIEAACQIDYFDVTCN